MIYLKDEYKLTDDAYEYPVIYTSSDIKELAKKNKTTYLEVAEKFELIGLDSNGNSYYVPEQ